MSDVNWFGNFNWFSNVNWFTWSSSTVSQSTYGYPTSYFYGSNGAQNYAGVYGGVNVTSFYPTYGNFGAQNYTSGRIGGNFDASTRAVDDLDRLYKDHDREYGIAEQFPARSAERRDAELR